MLRLVSQFDNEKMRASVATPTCGPCCSCCCCCVVTTLASSIITSRNLGKIVEQQYQNSSDISVDKIKEEKKNAQIFGFFVLPIALLITYFGFSMGFFEIISSFISSVFPAGNIASLIILPVLVYTGVFFLFKRNYKISVVYIIATVVITTLAMACEVFLWTSFIFN